MPLRALTDLGPAEWLVETPEHTSTLGPPGFEAYARLRNPLTGILPNQRHQGTLTDPVLRDLVDVLARHTAVPHEAYFALWEGAFDNRPMRSPRVPFFGRRRPPLPTPDDPFSPEVMDGPRLHVGENGLALFSGPLAWVGDWGARAPSSGEGPLDTTPQLMWPSDRAWFVASDIDTTWTGVGGSRALIAELETHPAMEVVPTTYGPQPDPEPGEA